MNNDNSINTVSSYIAQAFINMDYNEALNLYLNSLQSILHKILMYTKDNGPINHYITDLIDNETNIHTIIINILQILKEQPSSDFVNSKIMSKKHIATLHNVEDVLNFLERSKQWLYLSCNFKYFLMKVIELNSNDLIINDGLTISFDTIQYWKIVYDKIINNHQYTGNNLYLINTIWFQQLRIISLLYFSIASRCPNGNDNQQKQQKLNNELQSALKLAKTQIDTFTNEIVGKEHDMDNLMVKMDENNEKHRQEIEYYKKEQDRINKTANELCINLQMERDQHKAAYTQVQKEYDHYKDSTTENFQRIQIEQNQEKSNHQQQLNVATDKISQMGMYKNLELQRMNEKFKNIEEIIASEENKINNNNQHLNLEARIIYLLQYKDTDINKLIQNVKSLTDELNKNDDEKIQLDKKLQDCVTHETLLKGKIDKQNDELQSLDKKLQDCVTYETMLRDKIDKQNDELQSLEQRQHTVTQTYEQECSKSYYIQFYNDLENIFKRDFKMITDDTNLTEKIKYRNILQSLQEKINHKEIYIRDLNSENFRLNENENKKNKIINLNENQTKLKDQMKGQIVEYDTKIRHVEDRVNKICKNLKQMIGEEEKIKKVVARK